MTVAEGSPAYSAAPEAQSLLDREITRKLELTRFGSMAIASVVSGQKLGVEDIISLVQQSTSPDTPDTAELTKRFIQSTGILVRYSSNLNHAENRQVLEKTTQIGAQLIRALMQEQDWDYIDCLIDTSASLQTDIGKQTLINAGIDPEKVVNSHYRIACAGAVTAFVDSLADPTLKGKRIIICALEPLSRHISQSQYSLENLNIPAIFGDDFAAIAYNTADFELVEAKTHVIPDGGIIRFQTDYDLPPHDPESVPSHYVLADSAQSIISISKEGVFIDIKKPRGNLPSEMEGIAAAKFFIRHTSDVIKQVLTIAKQKGVEPRQAIMHQPSLKVNNGIFNKIRESGLDIEVPEFLLGDIERSNSIHDDKTY